MPSIMVCTGTVLLLQCMFITVAVIFVHTCNGLKEAGAKMDGGVGTKFHCVGVKDVIGCQLHIWLLTHQHKKCPLGYNGTQPNNCVDINECYTDNGGCGHYCTNTNGSYECSCKDGYFLSNDNHSCEVITNVDECEVSNGGCDHSCHNTNGSYYCTCNTGYSLLENHRGCTDIDECLQDNGFCEQGCNNSIGDYHCYCYDGYSLENDTFCEDIDECLIDNGGCSHVCINTNGSYECSCEDGYTLNNDNTTCNETRQHFLFSVWVTKVIPLILGICIIVLLIFCVFITVTFISSYLAQNKYTPVSRHGNDDGGPQSDQELVGTNDELTTEEEP